MRPVSRSPARARRHPRGGRSQCGRSAARGPHRRGSRMSRSPSVVLHFRDLEIDDTVRESVQRRCDHLADEFHEVNRFELTISENGAGFIVHGHATGKNTDVATHAEAEAGAHGLRSGARQDRAPAPARARQADLRPAPRGAARSAQAKRSTESLVALLRGAVAVALAFALRLLLPLPCRSPWPPSSAARSEPGPRGRAPRTHRGRSRSTTGRSRSAGTIRSSSSGSGTRPRRRRRARCRTRAPRCPRATDRRAGACAGSRARAPAAAGRGRGPSSNDRRPCRAGAAVGRP